MDCLWFPRGNDRMLDEGEQYRSHLIHTLGINRDHCTLGHSMLQLEGIHHQSDIQLWEWMEDESGGVKELNIDILRSLQILKGSPMNPLLHVQVGLCRLTEHSAFVPHARVVHGSRHFSCMHARWSGHSGLVVHSGLGAKTCIILW